MKKRLSVVVACLMWLVTALVFAQAKPSVTRVSFSRAVNKAVSAVVSLKTLRIDRYTKNNKRVTRKKTRTASGVLVDSRGYILTNNHVIKGVKTITVVLSDRRSAPATLIGVDKDTDLAVLRIRLPHLPVMPLGDSDKLKVGDVVLAIGNPYGLGQAVTQGIVSALGRTSMGINQLESYIQTDAAINPGNSGGALINVHGDLIGINTGIYTKSGGYQGIGFAIPSNSAMNVLQQIVHYGHVKRGWIGLHVMTINQTLVRKLKLPIKIGVVVTGFTPYGRRMLAKQLSVRDVVTFIDRHPVSTATDFINYIAQRKPGSTIKLTVLRGHKKRIVSVRVRTKGVISIKAEGKNYLPDQRI